MQLRTPLWNRRRKGGLEFTEMGLGTAPLAILCHAVSDDDADAVMEAAWAGGCYGPARPISATASASGLICRTGPRSMTIPMTG